MTHSVVRGEAVHRYRHSATIKGGYTAIACCPVQNTLHSERGPTNLFGITISVASGTTPTKLVREIPRIEDDDGR